MLTLGSIPIPVMMVGAPPPAPPPLGFGDLHLREAQQAGEIPKTPKRDLRRPTIKDLRRVRDSWTGGRENVPDSFRLPKSIDKTIFHWDLGGEGYYTNVCYNVNPSSYTPDGKPIPHLLKTKAQHLWDPEDGVPPHVFTGPVYADLITIENTPIDKRFVEAAVESLNGGLGMIRVIATKKFGDQYKQLITDAAKAANYTLEEQYTDAEGSIVFTVICTPKG